MFLTVCSLRASSSAISRLPKPQSNSDSSPLPKSEALLWIPVVSKTTGSL
jgi:hypothetical protein